MAQRVLCSSLSRRVLAALGLAGSMWALAACSATEQVADKVNDDARQMSVANQQVCAVEHKTFAVAAEAAMAMNGAYPASEAELVALGMMVEPPANLDYAPTADGSYVISPTPGGPCEGFTP